MAIFSLFSSKSKSSNNNRWSKAPSSPTQPNAPATSLLQLKLPSPSLLVDSPSRLVVDRPAMLAINANLNSLGSSAELSGGEDSTPLSSPWIEVDEVIELEEGKRQRENLEKEQGDRRLGRARLEVEDVIDLLRECGSVIRSRGSTTLGIFRPYRLAESPPAIRKLSILFLSYAQEFDASKDIWGNKVSKDKKFEQLKDELKYTGIHDVVSVIKWGLRHLVYSTPFDGSTSTTKPFAWYNKFTSLSSSELNPTDAFNTLLLPLLPPTSQQILLESLYLLEALTANSELNAMTARKLSRTIALYIFGLANPSKEWTGASSSSRKGSSFDELYVSWQEAGDVLEGVFKAYLRNQPSLPKRLKEVLDGYPGKSSADGTGRKVRVLRIEVQSQGDWRVKEGEEGINDQNNGLAKKLRGRRTPLEILSASMEGKKVETFAEEEEDTEEEEARREWSILVGESKIHGDPRELLSEETRRILELVGLAALPSSTKIEPIITTALTPLNSSPTSPPKWTRSNSEFNLSSSSSYLAPMSSYGNSRATSTYSTLSTSVVTTNGTDPTVKTMRRITPSWADFSSSGFQETLDHFGLEAPITPLKPSPVITVKSDNSRASKTSGMKRSKSVRLSDILPPVDAFDATRETITTILSVKIFEIDEEFSDVWLDTLVDPACSNWPSFIIADLLPSLVTRLSLSSSTPSKPIEKLLVIESLIPYKAYTPSIASTSRSIPRSVSTSKGWNKRVSGIFSSNLTGKVRTVNGGMSSSPSITSFSNQSTSTLKRSIKLKPDIEPILEATSPVSTPKKPSNESKSIKSTVESPPRVKVPTTPLAIMIQPLPPTPRPITPPPRSSTTISRPYTPDIPSTPSRPTRNPSRISLRSMQSFHTDRSSSRMEGSRSNSINKDDLLMMGEKLEGRRRTRKDSGLSEVIFMGTTVTRNSPESKSEHKVGEEDSKPEAALPTDNNSPIFSTPDSLPSELHQSPESSASPLPLPISQSPAGLVLAPITASKIGEVIAPLPGSPISIAPSIERVRTVPNSPISISPIVPREKIVGLESEPIVIVASEESIRRPSRKFDFLLTFLTFIRANSLSRLVSTSSSLTPIMIKPLSSIATPPQTPTKPIRAASIPAPAAPSSTATLAIPVIVGAPLSLSVSSSSSARTIVLENSFSGNKSLQSPPSPTTALTPTKKLSNAIGSLLRRKKSVAPNSGRSSTSALSLTGKVTEKEQEKALRETQKKQAKEDKKTTPVAVSSVKKRVLEIEAEEAAKLREVKTSNGDDVIISGGSRMGSLSEGSRKSPKAVAQVLSPVDVPSESSKVQEAVSPSTQQIPPTSSIPFNMRPQSGADVSPRSPDVMSFPRSPSESTIIPLPSTFIPSTLSVPESIEEKEGGASEATRLGSFSSTASADTTTSFQTANSDYE